MTPDLLDLRPGELRQLRSQLIRELEQSNLERTRREADAIRDRCRSFAQFVREAWHIIEPGTPLRWNWHLDAMCEHLEAITWGRMTPWLIINVPPGSSKSTIVSVLWQAWEWGPCGKRHLRYVSTSFEEENVARDTRNTRKVIRSEWYRTLWPEVHLVRSAETSFENEQFGNRVGVPFSSLTGKRGDRVLIDDPHSVDGAESETRRNKATRSFLEGGLNRTNDAETSAMIVVMQRLHNDDLTGVLMARQLGFVHLFIPMEFEPARRFTTPIGWTDPRTVEGELMDPERVPQSAIDRQKKAGDYSWNGQYQQRPAPRDGGLFKVDKIEKIKASPGGGVATRGWDLAGTKRKTSAYTVGLKLRRTDDGQLIIEDVKRDRASPLGVKTMVRGAAISDGLLVRQSLPQDPGQAGVAQKIDYAVNVLDGCNFRFTPESGDKEFRAQGIASAIEAGIVQMVEADWNSEFIEELRSFPNGSFKDQVDALSRAYTELLGKREADESAGPETVDASEGSADVLPAGVDMADPWGL